MKKFRFFSAIIVLSLLFTACSAGQQPQENPGQTQTGAPTQSDAPADVTTPILDVSELDLDFSSRDRDASYDTENATAVVFADSGSTVQGNGAVSDGANVTVTEEGVYLLSGSVQNGSLTVAAPEDAKVQLVFCGLSLTCADGPALYVRSADKVFCTLADVTENRIADGVSYTYTDGETTPDAAIFSRADLTINGSGTLTVTGNTKHGIVSKDDLIITGGTLFVTAPNVALNGKDCVKIGGGTMELTAGSDGIRSDCDTDPSRGYVYIQSGNIRITAESDTIQAQTSIILEDGTLDLCAGNGAQNGQTHTDAWDRGPGQMQSSQENTAPSAKGLKAGGNIQLAGGTVTADTADDCIHANGSVQISGGSFTLRSGDDGIHADTSLNITEGTVNILQSYEGLESASICISGGNVSVTASDDGINAAGGTDASALGGRPGQGNFASSSGDIVISGGYLVIDASGDGIDSNGTLTVSGGITLVSGPTDNANGALDYQTSATVTGGILIALGSQGMSQNFSEAQNQGALIYAFSAQTGGTSFALQDENGRAVVSFTPNKAYQSAVVTAPGIQDGGTYTLVAGGTVENTDQNGFAQDAVIQGGSVLATVTMSGNLYGSVGPNNPGGGDHGGGQAGNRPGGNFGGMPPR